MFLGRKMTTVEKASYNNYIIHILTINQYSTNSVNNCLILLSVTVRGLPVV